MRIIIFLMVFSSIVGCAGSGTSTFIPDVTAGDLSEETKANIELTREVDTSSGVIAFKQFLNTGNVASLSEDFDLNEKIIDDFSIAVLKDTPLIPGRLALEGTWLTAFCTFEATSTRTALSADSLDGRTCFVDENSSGDFDLVLVEAAPMRGFNLSINYINQNGAHAIDLRESFQLDEPLSYEVQNESLQFNASITLKYSTRALGSKKFWMYANNGESLKSLRIKNPDIESETAPFLFEPGNDIVIRVDYFDRYKIVYEILSGMPFGSKINAPLLLR